MKREVLNPETLKKRWNRISGLTALLSTIALSVALLLGGEHSSRLIILWLGCLPAFWVALKVLGAVAWNSSFKVSARIKLHATPAQVLMAELVCLLVLLLFHVWVSWVFAFSGLGVTIILAWILYVLAAIVAMVAVYLPALLVSKLLTRVHA